MDQRKKRKGQKRCGVRGNSDWGAVVVADILKIRPSNSGSTGNHPQRHCENAKGPWCVAFEKGLPKSWCTYLTQMPSGRGKKGWLVGLGETFPKKREKKKKKPPGDRV